MVRLDSGMTHKMPIAGWRISEIDPRSPRVCFNRSVLAISTSSRRFYGRAYAATACLIASPSPLCPQSTSDAMTYALRAARAVKVPGTRAGERGYRRVRARKPRNLQASPASQYRLFIILRGCKSATSLLTLHSPLMAEIERLLQACEAHEREIRASQVSRSAPDL